jgi:RHS repeat-associated protein
LDVVTTIAVDPWLMPRPRRISTSGANGSFDTGIFSYDGSGNVVSMGSDSFGYDTLSRVTTANLTGAGSQTCTYDVYGNPLTRTGGPNPFSVIVAASTNRINGYSYDARGNLSPPGETITYDALSRAMTANVSGVVWSYSYNGAGERVLKNTAAAGNTFTFRDPANRVVTEYAGTSPSRDNVFLGNLLVGSYANVSVSGNDTAHPWIYYSSDHLGTPRLLTDDMGATLEMRRSWPFGEDVGTPSTSQRLRFATMERDPEGLRYYDHARSHSFGLARFLSPDKLGGKITDPQSWNRYAYARNNPIRYYDPNGKEVADGVQLRKDRDYALATGGPSGLASFDRASMQGLKYGLMAFGAMAAYGAVAEYGPALLAAGQQLLSRFGDRVERAISEANPVLEKVGSDLATKGEAREVLSKMGLPNAQADAVRSAISRATSSDTIDILRSKAGDVVVNLTRPGADGRQVMEYTIGQDGAKIPIQKAYDVFGNLVHLDPK